MWSPNYPYFPVDSATVSKLPPRERVGLNFQAPSTIDGISRLAIAENGGVRQIWLTSGSIQSTDVLSFLSAAATRTMSIRLGTSILQVYTRHPYTTAQQALTIHDVAPGRLRLGMGVSHPHIMVDQLGLSLNRPISYLREYVSIVRALLWEGHVNHIGRHFSVQAALRRTARVPLLAAALGSGSFRLAGQVADGAISWMCPPSYLRAKALRSLGEGADLAGRPRPPLVAHMLVSLNTDHAAAHAAAKRTVEYYGKARFYLNMFRQAGYPIDEDPKCVDELADSLLISGTQETVREKILELLGVFDELLLTQLVTQGADQEWVELSRLVGSL